MTLKAGCHLSRNTVGSRVHRVSGLVVTGIDFNIAVIAPTARAKSVPFLLSLRRKGIRRAPHGGVPQIVAQRIPLPRDPLQT